MQKGDVVPDFTLPDQTGAPRRLSDFLANGPVVLFFYPAAMTYGCTKESCHFRDLAGEFTAAVTSSALDLPYLLFAAACGAIAWCATRIPRGTP